MPSLYQPITLTTPDGVTISGLRCGHGPIPLLVIPGAGDGLFTARDSALSLALYFWPRRHTYTITYLSRRDPIPLGFTLRDHARDFHWGLTQLHWGPGLIEANSGGGPIGQLLAADHPHLVRGLILTVTLHRTWPETRRLLTHWHDLARQGRWQDFHWDSLQHTFRPRTTARLRPLRPLLALRRPRHPERILRVLEGLMDFDHTDLLPRIQAPTLVIGGQDDQVVTEHGQREMARLIPHAELHLSPGYRHGNDQENPDYRRQLDRFARRVTALP